MNWKTIIILSTEYNSCAIETTIQVQPIVSNEKYDRVNQFQTRTFINYMYLIINVLNFSEIIKACKDYLDLPDISIDQGNCLNDGVEV